MAKLTPNRFAPSLLVVVVGFFAAPAHGSTGVQRDIHIDAKVAMTQLAKRYPQADALFRPGQPGAHVVTGLNIRLPGSTHVERATRFLTQFQTLIGIAPSHLQFVDTSRSQHRIVVRFTQTFGGRPVHGRNLAVRMEHDGTILGLVSDAMPIRTVPKAEVLPNAAKHIAVTWAGLGNRVLDDIPAKPVILALPGRAKPVWIVHVIAVPMRAHLEVMVDATDGTVLSVRNLVRH